MTTQELRRKQQMDVLRAECGRRKAGRTEPIDPDATFELDPLTDAERAAKLAELDGLISALQDELAETPDRQWEHPKSRYRLETLIRITARRHMLSL